MGDLQLSKQHLLSAYTLYGKFDSFWKRAILDSYLSLLHLREGTYAEALKSLNNAILYAGKMNSPGDVGVVMWTKAEIRAAMDENEEIRSFFAGVLNESLNAYIEQALRYLDKYRDSYEIGRLSMLKNMPEKTKN